jgi:hypothetical protein
MSLSLNEKRKSLSNSRSDVLDARIVANYGDPGLDENYHFDILSRFVIVMIESSFRVPTNDKWSRVFAVVARPRNLWVDVEQGRVDSPNSQKRADAMGNVSIGVAGSFSVAGIPNINNPYALGELIKIKKISNPIKVGEDSFFTSQFNDAPISYENWHSEGSTLPYFMGHQNRIDALRNKTVAQSDANNLFNYFITLYKYQYEAFALTLALGNSPLTSFMASVFDNSLPSTNPVYDGHGGYVFKSSDYVNFFAAEYEDININNKQRVSTNECIPLIVTTPNTFPTPRVRALGTISYNPSYATIIKQTP